MWIISLVTAIVISFLFLNFVYPSLGDMSVVLSFAVFLCVIFVGAVYIRYKSG